MTVSLGTGVDIGNIVTAETNPLTGGSDILIGSGIAPNQAYPSLRALKAALQSGVTTGIQVLTDSTGNETFEWPYTFAQLLAVAYPNYTVKHLLWDDATQDYAAPTTIQTGASGARYMDLVNGNYPRKLASSAAPHLTGIIDVRLDLTCEDWTPPNSFGATILCGESGGTGAWAWSLGLHTSGALIFYYSTDGTALSSMINYISVGIADGSRYWVRGVFTPDDGAGNRLFKAYKSTDGITWAQVGATVTTAGVVVVKDQVALGMPYLLGSQSTASNTTYFRVHEVQIRDGLDGPSICPRLPDGWSGYGAGTTCPVVGAPVLTVVNGAKAGAAISYLDDSTRRLKLTPDYSQSISILSCSHNQAQMTGRSWYSAYAAWVANVKSRVGSGVLALTQNPQTTAALDADAHARRRLDLCGFAKAIGVDVVDTFLGFLARTGWSSDYMADTIHPNAAGALVIRDQVKAAFDVS